MRRIVRAFALAFSVAVTAPVFAGTYSTSILQGGSGELLSCTVSNVGTTPAVLNVRLVDNFGNPVTPASNDCATILPGTTCSALVPGGASVRCVVDSSSTKIRATLQRISATGSTTVSVPATKR